MHRNAHRGSHGTKVQNEGWRQENHQCQAPEGSSGHYDLTNEPLISEVRAKLSKMAEDFRRYVRLVGYRSGVNRSEAEDLLGQSLLTAWEQLQAGCSAREVRATLSRRKLYYRKMDRMRSRSREQQALNRMAEELDPGHRRMLPEQED